MSEKSTKHSYVDHWHSANQIFNIFAVVCLLSCMVFVFPVSFPIYPRSTAVTLNEDMTMPPQGLAMGVFGPALMDLAEIYGTEANDIALVNSMRAFGTLIGSIIGETNRKFTDSSLEISFHLPETMFILCCRRLFLQIRE